MEYRLVKPKLIHQAKYLEYVKEWNLASDKMVPYSSQLNDLSYQDFLVLQANREDITKVPKEFVPSSFYLFVDEVETILGAVSIRHFLNDHLLSTGGHIGYGIRPSMRGKHLAKKMLSLALKEAYILGITKALVTCDTHNIPSRKTIESCGGVLENQNIVDGVLQNRYWITLD
ncbi:MAG: GNAT family N-acetyltransferase [bacterium]|nr:GNAT family N-acetyltransferase [bacterium]